LEPFLGISKVGYQGTVPSGYEEIARLGVAVDDRFGVEISKAIHQISEENQDVIT
jgi:hypothetical protein